MVVMPRKFVDPFQDWINLVLAVVLFASPWLFGYTATTVAMQNAWVCGVVIAVLALAALIKFKPWEEWISILLGLWLIIAPWVLGFSTVMPALWSHVILGVVIAAMAGWRAWWAPREAAGA